MSSKAFFLFVFTLSLILIFRIFFYFHHGQNLSDGQEVSFTTTLLSEPKIFSNYQVFTATYGNFFSGTKVFVSVPNDLALHYGHTVTISGTINVKVLNNKNIAYTVYSSHIEATKNKQNIALALIYFIRQKIISLYQNCLPATSSALLLGIVFGIKTTMSNQFTSDLQATGFLHVIAASGMNVTMVSAFLLSLFGFFTRRQFAIFLSMLGIVFYCIFSGLEPSILRAGIMSIMLLAGQLFGRQYSASYAIFLAGFFMLFYDPSLILDVGFQLSFCSTLGLLYLRPLVPLKNIFGEDITTTIAAQIATLPILLGAFGTYGITSVLVNALVLWTIPPLMILGGLGGLIGLVIPVLGNLFLLFAIPLLWYFEVIVTWFGNLHITLAFSSMPVEIVIGYYLLLIAGVFFVQQSFKHRFKENSIV